MKFGTASTNSSYCIFKILLYYSNRYFIFSTQWLKKRPLLTLHIALDLDVVLTLLFKEIQTIF